MGPPRFTVDQSRDAAVLDDGIPTSRIVGHSETALDVRSWPIAGILSRPTSVALRSERHLIRTTPLRTRRSLLHRSLHRSLLHRRSPLGARRRRLPPLDT